jgi:N-formylglutamate deformylase
MLNKELTYDLRVGRAPLLISMPHNGTQIPEAIMSLMTEEAIRVPDTDWHIARLYQMIADSVGASVLTPRYSRYVIDLNRPAHGEALYPGLRETGLVPLETFSEQRIYRTGHEPTQQEKEKRVDQYWLAYHNALREELLRLKSKHGCVVLWEAHSIRSQVPMFFDGCLPDLNLGTVGGLSASAELQQRLALILESQSYYSFAINGRFKGGYITRNYAAPEQGISAVQLEIAQKNYMDEDTFLYHEERAIRLQELILELLHACVCFATKN